MKRALAVLLSVCLMLPLVSTVAWAGSDSYKKLVDIPYSYNGIRSVDGIHEILSHGVSFDPIDLTAYGYPTSGVIETGKLGLQMDLCISGNAAVVKEIGDVKLDGQLEISSSGSCDKEELNVTAGVLEWKGNEWNRVVVDLAKIQTSSGGVFNPANFNYMRMYVGGLGAYDGQFAYVKVANVQIVDLTRSLAADETLPLGDGTPADEVPPQSIVFDAPAYKELANIAYNGVSYTYATGEVYSVGTKTAEPIDLTQWGYPTSGKIEPGKLGLQMDYYIDGGPNAMDMLEKGLLSGQIEISSGGACDVKELACSPTHLKGKAGQWVRVYLDFSWFTSKTGGEFDPHNLNYFRMYLSVGKNYDEEQVIMRFANLRVVDLSQPLTEEEMPEIGDGTFTPDPPEFTVQTVPAGFVTDTAVVAGYNVKQYAAQHGMHNVTDWSPIIQSLAFGLAAKGGGALYIPTGIYPCYKPLNLPTGVTLQGDWANPDESLQVAGTVLAIYTGKDSTAGAFIQMAANSYIRSMAFWYPEQNAAKPSSYPYTIQMGTTTHLKDITLVNSYYGIATVPGSCPDTENIYGTPLFVGMEMDMISDSYGMENINFAPDYWMYSGLPGAPSSKADAEVLRNTLYDGATGIVVRRMDWSWTTYTTIKGYSVGMYFAKSNGGEWYPNGQCYELTFEDCFIALRVDNVGGAGMVINAMTVKNCNFGVFYTGKENTNRSSLTFFRTDISATEEAVVVESPMAKVSFQSSIIRRGDVRVAGGWFSMLDSEVLVDVTLEQGAQMGIFAAVTDAWGDPIEVNNKAYCPLWQEDENPVTAEQPVISREDGLYSHHRAASSAVTVAALDNTGKTDISAALNALLKEQAKTGGTVFLPPGFYRVDNPITVPTGVELLGSLDFGQAELYNGVGSILQIYHGKNQPDAATIIVKAGAGVRGLQINYPEQNMVDGSFIPYAHTIQGQGDGAYVINVSSRNSWSGVDFMTYRCDNHYIDSFRGSALKSYVAVGGGAENGVVRNCHLQYTSWTYGDDGTRGAWPRVVEDPTPAAREAWRMDLYIFSGHNLDCYTIGHVKNQLHFGNMNYCGYTGINAVAEKTGAADVTIFGQNTDCCTISMNIEAARRVDFISLQTTAFTWILNRQEAEMNLIHLGKDCNIEVNVFGAALYENPDYMFDVENGTLNIWGGNYKSSVPMTNLGKNGHVNMVDSYFGAYQSAFDKQPAATELKTAVQNPQNLNISYSLYYVPMAETDTLGTFRHVYDAPGGFRLDLPENLDIPQDGEVLFSEGFTDYDTVKDEDKKVTYLTSGDGNVQARRGNLQITHSGVSLMIGIAAADQLALTEGKARLESRVNIDSMRETKISTFVIALYDEEKKSVQIARFDKTGAFQVNTEDGWKTVGNFNTGTWYRVGLVVDMDAGTVAAYLMDDDYNVLATGGAQSLGTALVRGMWMYAEADFDDATKTVVQVDYMAAVATNEAYGMLGDVDGNGKVDSTDARLILQYAVGKIDGTKLAGGAADVDRNRKIDSTDARLVLQYAVGKIQGF